MDGGPQSGPQSEGPRTGHPRRLAMKQHETDLETIDDFGRQWARFPEITGWLSSQDCLRDHFGPLMSIDEFRDKHVADIGSGPGRIVRMLLDAGAARVTAIEPSDAFFALERHMATERSRVDLIHDTGEAVGRLANLDFVVAFGVLQFILNPKPVMDCAYAALRPGGRIVVWLYGREGNEVYLRVLGALRTVTKRLPDGVLSGLASLLNLVLDAYIPLCRAFPLPMRAYMLNHLGRLDRRMRKLTVFDQLNPRHAKYYREAEARALVADAGFEDVRTYHRHGYSWTVIGSKSGG